MNIILHVEPGKIYTRKQFEKVAPRNSIAFDGIVAGPSFENLEKNIFNFNHHDGVNRYATFSSCFQAIMAIRFKIYNCMRDEKGQITVHLFTNDCDQDCGLTYFALKNPHLVEAAMNPLINKLAYCENMMDMSGGLYPFPQDLEMLEIMAWIFEHYNIAVLNGDVDKKDPDVYRRILEDTEGRIHQYMNGNAKRISLDTGYTVCGGGKGWKMVEKYGTHARAAFFVNGIESYVMVRPRHDGKWTYTIGKYSPYIPTFNLIEMYDLLNKLEDNPDDKWGGGDTIGGSPRLGGSKFSPEELECIINEYLQNKEIKKIG